MEEEFEAGAGMPAVCRRIKGQNSAVLGDDFALIVSPRQVPLRPFVVKNGSRIFFWLFSPQVRLCYSTGLSKEFVGRL
jgi:hypothetical protein